MLPIIKPMEPVSTDILFERRDWIYQIKWDGVRILSNIEPDKIRLYTRNGNDRTNIYPEVTDEIKRNFPDQTLILDGEMVALENGRPNFFYVLKRDRLKNALKIRQTMNNIPVYYIIFDVLYVGDRWLSNEPLTYRLEVMDKLKKKVKSSSIQFCPSYEDAHLLYNYTKENGWEGVILKERDGLYHPGKKHPTWKKIKHFQDIEAWIIGIELKNKRAYSMLLASQQGDVWRYLGKAATGLSQEELLLLTDQIEELITDTPLVHLPSYSTKDVRWLKPLLRVSVRFLEYSPEGQLRSPIIKGFVNK